MSSVREKVLKNRKHGEILPKSLWKLRKLCKEESLCDVTIIINKERFPAHKVVLTVFSEYFRSMFTGGFKESTDNEVVIQGDPKIFSKLLRFIYRGKMNILMEDFAATLGLACYLQCDDAIHACESYLWLRYEPGECEPEPELWKEDPFWDQDLEEVPLTTAFQIERIASAHGLTSLTDRNRRYIAENFKRFSEEPIFNEQCSIEILMSCLQCKGLEDRYSGCCSETQVLQILIKWLNHSWEERKEHTLGLLKMLRLGRADIAVVKALLDDDKMMSTRECKELIEGVLQLSDTKETAEVPLHISHPEMFASRNTISALIAVRTDEHKLMFYDSEDMYEPLWSTLNSPKLPCSSNKMQFQKMQFQCQDKYSLVVVNGRLYTAGCNSFFCLDDNGKKWKQLASMKCPVEECHLVELNGYIYAINSGKDSERYNLKENTWEVLPSRSNSGTRGNRGRLTYLSVVGFDGKLLVYGKYYKHAIQVYDPDVNKWYEVTLPPHRNGYKRPPILTVHEGALYRVAYDQNGRHPVVNHLQYVPDDQEGAPSIILAEMQEQKGIPDKKSQGAFCIGQEVFINVHGRVVKIGQNGMVISSLIKWKNVMSIKKRYACCTNSALTRKLAGEELAIFTFDMNKWD